MLLAFETVDARLAAESRVGGSASKFGFLVGFVGGGEKSVRVEGGEKFREAEICGRQD